MDKTTRLNKYLALQLGISRREADALIEQGKVSINDKHATLGARFLPGDELVINGKKLIPSANYTYVLFNKPTGFVCSRRVQGNTPTIYSLLPGKFQALKTVGRLDKDSSGLILLTNDGDFTYRMTHPKFRKIKIYEISLDKSLEPLHQQMISDIGIQLDDGRSQLLLEKLRDNRKTWRVIMHEGRNRQIRRTFKTLGYTIKRLRRTQFGSYQLGSLTPGKWRIKT